VEFEDHQVVRSVDYWDAKYVGNNPSPHPQIDRDSELGNGGENAQRYDYLKARELAGHDGSTRMHQDWLVETRNFHDQDLVKEGVGKTVDSRESQLEQHVGNHCRENSVLEIGVEWYEYESLEYALYAQRRS
jgi:hypothetical protein